MSAPIEGRPAVPSGCHDFSVWTRRQAIEYCCSARLPATSANDDRKGRLDLSRMSNETLARDLYISTQLQLRFPQLPSGAYRAAVEHEIRKRGYSIESMLRAADAATAWDKDEAWDVVRAALERQHPKSS
jgi:hypothetical protein